MFKKILSMTILFYFLVLGGYAGALTITDDFSTDPSARWSLNENASWDGLRITLTPDSSDKRGSIWYKQSFGLSKYSRLEAEFDIYLGYHEGADGITFALIDTSNGLNAIGGWGGDLGYKGINNSLAVEFDTYKNDVDTTSSDHVGIDLNGDYHSLTIAALPNLEDNNWHHVKVDFDLSGKAISVWVDNDLKINNYVVSDFTPFQAYVGFTGATGGLYNLQQVDNFNLNLTPVPLPGTIGLLGGGLLLLGITKRSRFLKI